MGKQLIVFTDSGDTLIDESTQIYDANGIVTRAEFVEGAEKVLKNLHEEGFTVALVADGEWDSFQNVYRENGMGDCFDVWVVSEVVGCQKPEQEMFETAMKKLNLTDADKKRIVMIGNNLKKDVAGANQFGITSIWVSWSPRYFHEVENEMERPDYEVKKPEELLPLLHELNKKIEHNEPIRPTTQQKNN